MAQASTDHRLRTLLSGAPRRSSAVRLAWLLPLLAILGCRAAAYAQAIPDVVDFWSSDLLHEAARRAADSEQALAVSEQFERSSVPDSLDPAEWPRAYAALLAQRAQTAGLVSSMPTISRLSLSLADVAPIKATPSIEWIWDQSSRRQQLRPLVRSILRHEGLPEALLAVPLIESGFDPFALSPKGARGLWQLMPDTARQFGLDPDRALDERLDPVLSTRAAALYLKELYGRWGDWRLALAAYNAGPGRVQEALARSGAQSFQASSMLRLLPDETQRYVPKVFAAAKGMGANFMDGGLR